MVQRTITVREKRTRAFYLPWLFMQKHDQSSQSSGHGPNTFPNLNLEFNAT